MYIDTYADVYGLIPTIKPQERDAYLATYTSKYSSVGSPELVLRPKGATVNTSVLGGGKSGAYVLRDANDS